MYSDTIYVLYRTSSVYVNQLPPPLAQMQKLPNSSETLMLITCKTDEKGWNILFILDIKLVAYTAHIRYDTPPLFYPEMYHPTHTHTDTRTHPCRHISVHII